MSQNEMATQQFESVTIKIPCSIKELRLDITLKCGQSFRWHENNPGKWTGMIHDTLWTLSQDDDYLYCLLHNFDVKNSIKEEMVQTEKLDSISNEKLKVPTNNQVKTEILQEEEINIKSPDNSMKKTECDFEDVHKYPMKRSSTTENELIEDIKKMKRGRNTTKIKSEKGTISSTPADTLASDTSTNLSLPGKKEVAYTACSKAAPKTIQDYTLMVQAYFRLEISLDHLYMEWSRVDANFACIAESFPGVRMLDQPSVENVFSFICSSNNNITRISQLVEKLCMHFGKAECEVDGKVWHSFPPVDRLCQPDVEDKLRTLGFGYRASYIWKSAQLIAECGGEAWLTSLRLLPYEECHKQLCRLTGVGPKVSDCICLMSMGHLATIPVDTHVFQIAARDYLPELRSCKTVTDRVYKKIAQHFRDLYGDYAGWAHSVLFSADLKNLQQSKTKTQVKK